MGFGGLLKTVRKLNRMGRWANEYMTEDVRPTVSSHLFTTTQVAQMLGIIEEQNGAQIDWKKLYQKAINHDIPEALSGDILSHVKNKSKQMKEMVQKIESELMEEEIYKKLPKEFVNIYKEVLEDGKDETIEGKILEASDKIDCLIECIIEINRGNPEKIFADTFYSYIDKLQKMNLYSVDYFLEYVLPELQNK